MNPLSSGSCRPGYRGRVLAVVTLGFLSLGRVNAISQGHVNFANLVIVNGQRVVDAPVRDEGGNLLSGSGFKAQLYAGPAGSAVENLSPVGSPASFLTGTGAGYWLSGSLVINSVVRGDVARVQVRVWRVADGATWEQAFAAGRGFKCSNVLDVQTPAEPSGLPVNLIGLTFGPIELTCFPGPEWLPPVISVQPQHQNVVVGSDVRLTVQALSASPIGIRWYFNGTPLQGETNAVLALHNIQPSAAGHYFAVVSRLLSSAMSETAVVSVNAPPISPLTNLTVIAWPGLSLLTVPLVTSNHTVAGLFPAVPNGSSIFKVDGNGFIANNYLFGWSDPAMTIVPGEGWFFRNPTPTNLVLSFEGRAVAGVSTNRLTQGYFLCGSIPPVSGELGELQYPGEEFDAVFVQDPGRTNYCGYYSNYCGFYFILGAWLDYSPHISVGQGFWGYKEDGRGWLDWTQTYGASNAGSYRIVQPRITSVVPEVNFFTFHTNQSFGRVFDVDGVTPVSAGFVGQLYVGPSEASLTSVGNPAPVTAGYVTAASLPLPGFSNGQIVYAQLRVWEAVDGGTYEIASGQGGARSGRSAVVAIVGHAPLLPGLPPNNVNTFPSFAVAFTPPAIVTIEVLGSDVRLQIATGAGARYRVETATSLEPDAQWTPMGSVGDFTGTGGTVAVMHAGGSTQAQRFYRVVEITRQ